MVINEERTIHHFVVVTSLVSIEIVGATSSTLVLVAVLVLVLVTVLVLVLVMVLVTIGAIVDIVIRAATLVALTTSRPVVLLVGSWIVSGWVVLVVLGSRGLTGVGVVSIPFTVITLAARSTRKMMELAGVAKRVCSTIGFLGWVLCSRWSSSNHIVSSLALFVA